MCGNGVGQRSGHDGLDCHRILGHGALFNAACADVVQQQSAHFIAGYQLIAAIRALHGDAHTIRIGVGGQHQICTGLGGQIQTQLQSLKDLGVGVGAGGEVAVGILLLGHDGDVGDAHIVQHMGDRHQTGTVQRAVHQLQAGSLAQARAHLTSLNGVVQSLFAVIAHKADQALLHALSKGNVLCAGENVGLLDLIVDDGSSVIGHLAAVRAVGLVAVVLGRVVGLGKNIALQAAVVADGHGLGAFLGLDPVCQALRSLTDDINIHTVGASAQNAAQTSRAKLQSHRKAVLDLFVISLDLGQFRLQICVFQIGSHPALIFIQIHLAHLTFCKFFRKKKQV